MQASHRFFCAAILTAVFAACALLVPAEAQKGHPAARKNQPGRSAVADGRKLFDSVCATCHGLDGRGGERGPNIATRPEVQRLSDEETLRILQAGIPATGMPGFDALEAPMLQAVMGYLRTLQSVSHAVPIPGNPQRGKLLFVGKAGCANCHMINGAGGFLGADLSSYGSNVSLEEIRSAITDPHKDLDPRSRTVLATTREGRQFTGIARNEDNFSLQLQSLDGTFQLLAFLWQNADVSAMPIMRAPLRSHSLSEFWGKRWNLGFRQLSHDLIFRPLHGLLGVGGAGFLVFVISGLLHDLVISVPAKGGYGLPTIYFVVQGAGVAVERSKIGSNEQFRFRNQ